MRKLLCLAILLSARSALADPAAQDAVLVKPDSKCYPAARQVEALRQQESRAREALAKARMEFESQRAWYEGQRRKSPELPPESYIIVLNVRSAEKYLAGFTPQIEAARAAARACLKIEAEEQARTEGEAVRRAEEQAQAQKAEEARLAAFRAKPQNWQVLHTARLCGHQQERQQALTEIAKEHRYGRVGGVMNKAALYEQQQRVRRADEGIAAARAGLAKAKLSALSCGNKIVETLTGCLSDDEGEFCGRAPFSDYLKLDPPQEEE